MVSLRSVCRIGSRRLLQIHSTCILWVVHLRSVRRTGSRRLLQIDSTCILFFSACRTTGRLRLLIPSASIRGSVARTSFRNWSCSGSRCVLRSEARPRRGVGLLEVVEQDVGVGALAHRGDGAVAVQRGEVERPDALVVALVPHVVPEALHGRNVMAGRQAGSDMAHDAKEPVLPRLHVQDGRASHLAADLHGFEPSSGIQAMAEAIQDDHEDIPSCGDDSGVLRHRGALRCRTSSALAATVAIIAADLLGML
mmetsp:Transcript_14437/g.43032  ORF Transcript_14437/g.43032 Transcript_14437/m.43032 type:complete len:253 (-) Transcript_14437:400-1158(-)